MGRSSVLGAVISQRVLLLCQKEVAWVGFCEALSKK